MEAVMKAKLAVFIAVFGVDDGTARWRAWYTGCKRRAGASGAPASRGYTRAPRTTTRACSAHNHTRARTPHHTRTTPTPAARPFVRGSGPGASRLRPQSCVRSALGPAGRINGKRQTAAAAFKRSLGPEDAALARVGAQAFRKKHPAGAEGALKKFKALPQDGQFALRSLGCRDGGVRGGVRRSRPHTASGAPASCGYAAHKHTRAAHTPAVRPAG